MSATNYQCSVCHRTFHTYRDRLEHEPRCQSEMQQLSERMRQDPIPTEGGSSRGGVVISNRTPVVDERGQVRWVEQGGQGYYQGGQGSQGYSQGGQGSQGYSQGGQGGQGSQGYYQGGQGSQGSQQGGQGSQGYYQGGQGGQESQGYYQGGYGRGY